MQYRHKNFKKNKPPLFSLLNLLANDFEVLWNNRKRMLERKPKQRAEALGDSDMQQQTNSLSLGQRKKL